jgi:hypothetical protein
MYADQSTHYNTVWLLQGRKTAADWAENAKIQDLITGHGEH